MQAATVFILSMLLLILSCQHGERSEGREHALKAAADTLTLRAQQQIMSQLLAAIDEGGVAYAVDFCNLEALPLTRAAADGFPGRLMRVSDRNRNPEQALSTETDRALFGYFQANDTASDSLVREEDKYVYYKRINLLMPTCLKCHGGSSEIDEATRARIDAHYPSDQARGYELNELRGMWKVIFD